MRFFILLVALGVSGCSFTPMMQASNKAEWHRETISSVAIIYIASKLGTDINYISDEHFSKIDDAFITAGVKTDLYLFSGMDLNGEQKIQYYSSKNDYTLIVDPIARTKGDRQDITYQLNLLDNQTNKKVWIGTLWVPWGWTDSVYTRFDEMGALIVKRLMVDGLIDSSNPSSSSNKQTI